MCKCNKKSVKGSEFIRGLYYLVLRFRWLYNNVECCDAGFIKRFMVLLSNEKDILFTSSNCNSFLMICPKCQCDNIKIIRPESEHRYLLSWISDKYILKCGECGFKTTHKFG